jgi:hypothetical protein
MMSERSRGTKALKSRRADDLLGQSSSMSRRRRVDISPCRRRVLAQTMQPIETWPRFETEKMRVRALPRR